MFPTSSHPWTLCKGRCALSQQRALRTFTCTLIAATVLPAQERAKEVKPAISEQHYRIYHGDGRPATFDDLLTASSAATVTFLGESHDDAVAHYLEEKILRTAHKPDLALSLEMFETDVQQVVDEYLAGFITEDHLISSGRAWRNYKSDYRALVEFAKDHKMPVLAANAPRRYVNRVSRLGAATLSDLNSGARRFLPPLPYADATPAYAEKFHRVMDEARKQQVTKNPTAQPARPFDPVKGLQAQSLWDAGMAFSIASFLTSNPGMRVLHCNGSFHTAAKLGIPDHLVRYRPGTSMLVVTMMSEASFPDFDENKMREQGDFVIVTDPKLPRSYSSDPQPKAAEKK